MTGTKKNFSIISYYFKRQSHIFTSYSCHHTDLPVDLSGLRTKQKMLRKIKVQLLEKIPLPVIPTCLRIRLPDPRIIPV